MSQCRQENELPLWAPHSAGRAGSMVDATQPRMIFSASRIGTWIRCNRLAGWQYLAGYFQGETRATALGGDVHKALEELVPILAGGRDAEPDRTTEVGAIAAEVLPHIPPEMLCSDVEVEVKFTILGRHAWQGYKDLAIKGRVTDYKTTSDFRYMKTPEDLRYDPQAVLYAQDQFSAHPDLETVTLRWIYTRTRKPYDARTVDLELTRAHAQAMFAVLEAFADEMQDAADAAPPQTDPIGVHKYVLTLAGNHERCNDYGGCPHRARCNRPMFTDPNTPPETNGHMSPLERLKAMQATPATTPVSAAPPVAAQPAAPYTAATGASMLARVAAAVAGPNPGASNPHPMSARTDIPGDPIVMVNAAPPVAAPPPAAPSINPPARRPGRPRKDATVPMAPSAAVREAAATMPPPETAPAPGSVLADILAAPPTGFDKFVAEEMKSPTFAKALTEASAELAASLADPPPAMAAVIAAAAAARAEPTHKGKVAESAERVMETHGAALKMLVDAPAAPRPEPTPIPTPPVGAKPIETLCVGCAPVGHPYETLDALLMQVRDMIGLPAYFGGFGYKTNGMVSEGIMRVINARRIEVLVVHDPHAPEAALVLPFLRTSAAVVVESFR